jgi:cadmium resistance protein CadD (predicted permease)
VIFKIPKTFLFHPLFILLISIIAASLYFVYATLRFSGDKLLNQYYYVIPIVIPFTIFLFNRVERLHQRRLVQWLIDSAVVLTAMWRVIGDVPYISGHTLFLTYCLLTVGSLLGRITAIIVIIEVLYLKLFIWNDWITSSVGIILGIFATLFERHYKAD